MYESKIVIYSCKYSDVKMAKQPSFPAENILQKSLLNIKSKNGQLVIWNISQFAIKLNPEMFEVKLIKSPPLPESRNLST